MSKLTVLSFGGGQDSTAILYKIIYDKQFQLLYAPEDLLVVMADTGNEHKETDYHVAEVMKLCSDHDIEFWFITGSMGYTSPVWSKGLVDFYESGNRIGSKAFPKTCTDKLKITPIYNFLENYIFTNYYPDVDVKGRKRAIKMFAKKFGKIDVLIGIAKGEETRASSDAESPSVWIRESVHKVYPLITLNMDRQACQDYIEEVGHVVPPPSNCILCPFMSYQELLYMFLAMPDWYYKWIKLESNKMVANAHDGDFTKTLNSKGEVVANMGVWGTKTLPEALLIAQEKYGHMTITELKEYKMSHGHCVKSKY